MYVCVCSHMCTCVFSYKLIVLPGRSSERAQEKLICRAPLWEPPRALLGSLLSFSPIHILGHRPQEHSSGSPWSPCFLRASGLLSNLVGISEQEGCTAKPRQRASGLPCQFVPLGVQRGGQGQQGGMGPRRNGQMSACLLDNLDSCGLGHLVCPD